MDAFADHMLAKFRMEKVLVEFGLSLNGEVFMNRPQLRVTAYLNVAMRIRPNEGPFPVVTNVAIHSSPPGSLTVTPSSELWANVLEVEASDFATAQKQILEMVERYDGFAWMRIWVRPGLEAHQERFELYQQRQNLLDTKE